MSTPVPTNLPAGGDSLQIVFSLLSIILVGVQVFLVFRVDKARLKIERFVGISEKSGTELKLRIEGTSTEIMDIVNRGVVPIEELSAIVNCTIKRRDKKDISFLEKWERKTVLCPKETAAIPLNEKFYDFFKKQRLVETEEIKIGTCEDPETGDDVEDKITVASLTQAFSLMLDLQVEIKIEGQKSLTRKKYLLLYRPRLYPHANYEDDYEISVNEHMGQWVT